MRYYEAVRGNGSAFEDDLAFSRTPLCFFCLGQILLLIVGQSVYISLTLLIKPRRAVI